MLIGSVGIHNEFAVCVPDAGIEHIVKECTCVGLLVRPAIKTGARALVADKRALVIVTVCKIEFAFAVLDAVFEIA